MLAFPAMLIPAATEAGMPVPEDADNYDSNEFPHFYVFCAVQLGRPMNPGEHWDNAKVIAAVPEEVIRFVSVDYLVRNGLSWQT